MKSEWPFGLQWDTLGKFFSLYSLLNRTALHHLRCFVKGIQLAAAWESPQDSLNLVVLWLPLGFYDSYRLSMEKSHVTDSTVAVGPLSSTSNPKDENAQGEAVGGRCWVVVPCLFPPSSSWNTGNAVPVTSWEPPTVSWGSIPCLEKHWKSICYKERSWVKENPGVLNNICQICYNSSKNTSS